jgi:hypothetical protein
LNVRHSIPRRGARQRLRIVAALGALLAAASIAATLAASDQPTDDHVGVIEGDDLTVNGPVSLESVGGQIKTILRSGSDVRVKGNQAKITLLEGGQISICGPAHLSLLKSGGALTVALDSGVIHVHVEPDPAVNIYTPQIQGNTIAVGDGPRDMVVGFEPAGVMCIRTYRGAMHIQQQLGSESIMIPQGGDVVLTNGQFETLRNGEGHCRCELQIAKSVPLPVLPSRAGGSAASASEDTPAETAQVLGSAPHDEPPPTPDDAAAKEPPKDDRIYQVEMPPLIYDAKAKVQPEPDPRIMIIVRRVRVRPTLIFQGRVDAEPEKPAVAANAAPPAPVPAATPTPTAPVKKNPPPPPTFTERVRSFFRSLW